MQQRALANSYRAVEEINDLKRALRDSQSRHERSEKREQQLRRELLHYQNSTDNTLSTKHNPLKSEVQGLKLENEKLKVELKVKPHRYPCC